MRIFRYIFCLWLPVFVIGLMSSHDAISNSDPNDNSALLVPIGDIDAKLMEELSNLLSQRFSIPFHIARPLGIPEHAYNAQRHQYHSSVILNVLKQKFRGRKILGIIDRDLYVPELNFAFGQAELPGAVAVISITRLRQQFYGLPKDDKIFFERVVKEAVHELGHTYGLEHCPDPNCVMFFSNSLSDTDRKSSNFCLSCQNKME